MKKNFTLTLILASLVLIVNTSFSQGGKPPCHDHYRAGKV